MKEFAKDSYRVRWYGHGTGAKANPGCAAVVLCYDGEYAERVSKYLSPICTTLCVYAVSTAEEVGDDREEVPDEIDFSPFAAPSLRREGDIAGGGRLFLEDITSTVLPQAEQFFGLSLSYRMLVGYSMAGLLTLYGLYQSDYFQAAATVSGSLWLEGWSDFIREHSFKTRQPDIYLSVGAKEKRTANPRMQRVEEATRDTYQYYLYDDEVKSVVFELNPGGHGADDADRIRKAVKSLLSQHRE
jgi:predicted alpha/beta superfamily hydrolase